VTTAVSSLPREFRDKLGNIDVVVGGPRVGKNLEGVSMRVGVRIQRSFPDSTPLVLEFGGLVRISGPSAKATKEEIASMLLEAEMKGNEGNIRIHIDVAHEV